MDIILNTIFTHPNLPVVPHDGFFDDFERPEGSDLGTTTDGKPWEFVAPTGIWQIGAGGVATPLDTDSYALVDAGTSDGTLTATVAQARAGGGSVTRGGIIFRWQDANNCCGAYGAGDGRLTIFERVGGTSIFSSTVANVLSDGDVLSATMNGADISVSLNGAVLKSWVSTNPSTYTRHGLSKRAGATYDYTTWESIEYTAA